MEYKDYAVPFIMVLLLRIAHLWYKDSHSSMPSKNWREFYFKYDQDFYFSAIVTAFLYWIIPFQVYIWVADKINADNFDIDPKQWINGILSVIGIFSIQIFQFAEKYVKFILNKFTNGKAKDCNSNTP